MTNGPRHRPPAAVSDGERESGARSCSSWQYKHWRGDFYPEKLPQNRWLEYDVARFDTVEINSTFYRLPEASAFGRLEGSGHTRPLPAID